MLHSFLSSLQLKFNAPISTFMSATLYRIHEHNAHHLIAKNQNKHPTKSYQFPPLPSSIHQLNVLDCIRELLKAPPQTTRCLYLVLASLVQDRDFWFFVFTGCWYCHYLFNWYTSKITNNSFNDQPLLAWLFKHHLLNQQYSRWGVCGSVSIGWLILFLAKLHFPVCSSAHRYPK